MATWPVLMDHGQLEQVLLNLFINAGHAMPGEGNLTVSAVNYALREQEDRALGLSPGRFIQLVVADDGIGMDEATKARIFEPFFTTKASGEGTGLGLASAYGIIANHGGAITVESQPGRGTSFTILLPVTDQPIPKEAVVPSNARSGHATILVVDDEPLVLKLCARLLQALGYDTLTAAGGREAIKLVRQHLDRLSVVMLDMTMPEMSGARTYEAIRKIAPNVKVLLTSGYTADGDVQELLARGCNDFIQKPFDLAQLADKLGLLL